jgi:segregation and condensation protein A
MNTLEAPEHVDAAFSLRLDNFEGPFDLLLSLIAKHKLDVTEVALSTVTDEFIAHIKRGADDDPAHQWDLEQTTAFLVVASTLLDLKTARLLPQGDVEDEEDLALLEARDLLFARLLSTARSSRWRRCSRSGSGARHGATRARSVSTSGSPTCCPTC